MGPGHDKLHSVCRWIFFCQYKYQESFVIFFCDIPTVLMNTISGDDMKKGSFSDIKNVLVFFGITYIASIDLIINILKRICLGRPSLIKVTSSGFKIK